MDIYTISAWTKGYSGDQGLELFGYIHTHTLYYHARIICIFLLFRHANRDIKEARVRRSIGVQCLGMQLELLGFLG